MKNFLLSEMSGHDYKKANFDKAILCLGSTENHGDHLPLGTDSLISYELAKEVAKKVDDTMLLPVVPFGMSEHYSNFPIAISLETETLIRLINNILSSLIKHRIYKILIINGHDGNIASIETATREFKVSHPQIKIAVLNAWWVTAGKILPANTFEVWNGLGHAGEGETSMVLNLRPDLVNMKKSRGILPHLPQEIEIKWIFDEITPYGVTGDPTKATAEKGRKMKEALVNHISSFIKKMDEVNWEYKI